MTARTIIFTACPNGINTNNGKARLSVHIAPRLVPTNPSGGQLSEFSEWVTWPNQAYSAWTVVISPGFNVPAVEVTSPARDASRWGNLFPSTTFVRGRGGAEDFTGRKVRSYPAGFVFAHLRDHYAQLAASSGDQYPSTATLNPLLGPLRPRLIDEALNQIEILLSQNPTIPPHATANPTMDFAQLKRFHTPSALRNNPILDHSQDVQLPEFDFHQMVALAQDHPMLLRLLGLVIDLEFTIPDVSGLHTIYVVPTPNPAFPSGTLVSTPQIQCTVSFGGIFHSEPSAAAIEVADGYLRLDDTNNFGVLPVDQDGGGLKALDLSALIDSTEQKPSIDTPTDFSLPVLRSRGLGIFHTGRATSLRTFKFQRTQTNDAAVGTGSPPGTNITLYAEDITQGFRFDVIDNDIGTPTWRSLSARTGTMKFLNGGPALVNVTDDEAFSNVGATQAFDGSTDDLYVGETIISWNGWSLGAPRPAKVIDNTDQLTDQSNAVDPSGFQLQIDYAVKPGSLPRLRFGHTFQFRGRAVDLAGNSVALGDGSVRHATPPMYFGRLDPVESPAIMLRNALTAGEAVDRVVLRSNFNTAANPPTTERHLFASKQSELTCEMHGMFDTPTPNSVVDGSGTTYNLIAGRESKQVSDLAGATPDPGGGGAYYVDADHVRAPYLSDPVSAGALLRDFPGPVKEVALSWDGTWPDLGDVQVVMNEQPNPPAFPDFVHVPGTQRIDLYVGKADTFTLRLSTLPDVPRIRQFQLLFWMNDAGVLNSALRDDIQNGRNWMFTPFRTITFVHAVKQPLLVGTWIDLRVLRSPGDTFATLDGHATFSRKSTARLDLDATWDEYVDAGPGSGELPTRPDPHNPGQWLDRPLGQAIPLSTAISEEPLPQHAVDVFDTHEVPTPGPRHEFHDTKHRDVHYPIRVFSRFDEYFRKEQDITFSGTTPLLLDAAGIVKGSVRITSPGGPPTDHFTEDVDFTVDTGAGTVARIAGSPMPDNVHASWVPQPNDRVGPDRLVNVPSSARPDAPKLVYVIPTFQRIDTSNLLHKGSRRKGTGVRVYLERPWWVTGGGELLGVVMLTNPPFGPQASLNEPEARYVTQWGVDPAHAGAFTPENPVPASFPLNVQNSAARGIPELPGADLTVAGHEVGFDETRDLWYCDIDIDTGDAYFPFVRLALARWQPSSLGGLDVSPVVLADYVQLAADRVATVTPPVIIKKGVTPSWGVSLTGPGYNTSNNDFNGPRAQVRVQQRIAPGMTGDLAWDDVGALVKLTRFMTSGPTVTFTGSVKLPKGVALSDLRLVFEEFEQIETDDKAPPPAKGARKFGDRVTYADVVPLG